MKLYPRKKGGKEKQKLSITDSSSVQRCCQMCSYLTQLNKAKKMTSCSIRLKPQTFELTMVHFSKNYISFTV